MPRIQYKKVNSGNSRRNLKKSSGGEESFDAKRVEVGGSFSDLVVHKLVNFSLFSTKASHSTSRCKTVPGVALPGQRRQYP